MGLDPDDDDYDGGAGCAVCKDVLFGGKTPAFVFANVSGVSRCAGYVGPLPNGTWKLPKDPGLDCVWSRQFGELIFLFRAAVPCLFFARAFIGGFFTLFTSVPSLDCKDNFSNILICGPPINPSGTGGTCSITWGPDKPCGG